MKKKDK